MLEENPYGKNPCNQVGNPIHMQGSGSEVGFEPGSTEMKGRQRSGQENGQRQYSIHISNHT